MPDVRIATRLRAAGLNVREVAGWKTRGRDFAGVSPPFNPRGSVNHHTAGPPKAQGSLTPSLRIVTEGRSDLPGPLCNVYLGYDNVVYVVAAGVANHAGLPDGGSCRGMTGNSQAYGLEVEHPGTFPLGTARTLLAARIHAALIWHQDIPATQVVQHWEWAPSRKVDLGTNMHPGMDPTADGFRKMIAVELKKLEAVKAWRVSYLNAKRERVPGRTKNIDVWVKGHPGAFQRGRVHFEPDRA
jgi:N-acetylmuramoyl-L-alanine amidase-like protein